MRKLFEFIRSIYVVVLFVVLEVVAISYYAHSTHYTQARLLARSNQVVGRRARIFRGHQALLLRIGHENRLPARARVARARRAAAPQYEEAETAARLDSYMQDIGESKYRFVTASVVANTVNRAQNLITLNRGRQRRRRRGDGRALARRRDGGLRRRLHGALFAVAMSVLNTSFRASGKLADAEYYGSIYWDGARPRTS